VRRADAVAREVHALSEKYDFAQWIAFAFEIRGWVAFQNGDQELGIELMLQALARLHATGARTHSSRVLANLAESCLTAGRVAEARRHLDAAFAHRMNYGEQYYAPELCRLNALVLRAEGARPAEVRASLEEAIKIARAQQARLLEERAARTLAGE
jgi:tetratricopeptide (TPR) repeat protein